MRKDQLPLERPLSVVEHFAGMTSNNSRRSNNKKAPAGAGAFAFNDAPKGISTHQNVTLQLLI